MMNQMYPLIPRKMCIRDRSYRIPVMIRKSGVPDARRYPIPLNRIRSRRGSIHAMPDRSAA